MTRKETRKRPKPTKGELNAATKIVKAYRRLLDALGHPDELNKLPQEIKLAAQVIADHRND